MSDFEPYVQRATEGPERRKVWHKQFGWYSDDDESSARDRARVNPHCDDKVLHSPEEECEVCDLYPEAQMLRVQWGINFTGEHDSEKLPCPAESRRDLYTIDNWSGNRVHRDGHPAERKGRPITREEIAEARAALEEMERELDEG